MSGFFSKNVPAVRISQVIICHAACENYGFYGGLVIPFPAFSGVFSSFWLSCKEISCRIFPCFRCFLYRLGMHLCLSLLHLRHMRARTRPREIHNAGLFTPVSESIKKYSPITFLFPVIYEISSKNLQKSIA